MKKVISYVFLFLLSGTAWADIPLSVYKEVSESGDSQLKEEMENYVVGVGRGIFWANVFLEDEIKLFCMPLKLGLGKGLILDLLQQEIKAQSDEAVLTMDALDEMPIELLLTRAFTNVFPCED